MLFKNQKEVSEQIKVLESEKERNLYYKFFAGYFFNELVEGYQQRVSDFYKFLFPKSPDKASFCFGKPFKLPENTQSPDISVTFDFHSYLLDSSDNKGELADILIQDHANKLFITIEAKFLSNWDYDKDIYNNSKRIIKLERLTKQIYQVLLLKKDKLDAAVAKKTVMNSNIKKMESNETKMRFPLRIITWEQLFNLRREEKVIKYFNTLIEREKEDFRISS